MKSAPFYPGADRYPRKSEISAKQALIDKAKAEVERLRGSLVDASASANGCRERLREERNKLRELAKREARTRCFAEGKPYTDPETGLPEASPL